MEASMKEEEARIEKIKEIEQKEQEIIHKVAEVSLQETEEVAQVAVDAPQEAVKPQEEEEVKVAKKVVKAPGYSLPPVSLKKGGAGAFDAEFLKSQKEAILKGLNNMDEHLE